MTRKNNCCAVAKGHGISHVISHFDLAEIQRFTKSEEQLLIAILCRVSSVIILSIYIEYAK